MTHSLQNIQIKCILKYVQLTHSFIYSNALIWPVCIIYFIWYDIVCSLLSIILSVLLYSPFTIISTLLSMFLTDGESTVQKNNVEALAAWLRSAYTQINRHCVCECLVTFVLAWELRQLLHKPEWEASDCFLIHPIYSIRTSVTQVTPYLFV